MLILDLHRDFERFTFPAGEVGLRIKEVIYNNYLLEKYDLNISLVARIKNSQDVMSLLMATDAIRRVRCSHIASFKLVLPYVPYGRQDRVCNDGEALSVKVFADLINSLGYDSVTILDPHSDVTPALLNNCRIKSQEQLIEDEIEFCNTIDYVKNETILCPDAGAMKKTLKIAKLLEKNEIIMCEKERDLATGNIIATKIYTDSLVGKKCVIFDDICDGGRTFIEIAKKAKELGAESVRLVVTHGIFSKGLDVIFEHIDFVDVFDSYCSVKEYGLKFKALGIYEARFNIINANLV